MKKVTSIPTGLIAAAFAAVLLASVSTGASASDWFADFHGISIDDSEETFDSSRTGHWAPYTNAWNYFWGCTILQECAGSRWRD